MVQSLVRLEPGAGKGVAPGMHAVLVHNPGAGDGRHRTEELLQAPQFAGYTATAVHSDVAQ